MSTGAGSAASIMSCAVTLENKGSGHPDCVFVVRGVEFSGKTAAKDPASLSVGWAVALATGEAGAWTSVAVTLAVVSAAARTAGGWSAGTEGGSGARAAGSATLVVVAAARTAGGWSGGVSTGAGSAASIMSCAVTLEK